MANANLRINVDGVDKTGAAFRSIQWRAKSVSAKMASMLGGALAAAGAYLSFNAVKSGVDELGKLSDIAMRTSTNVDDLTRASTALSILGVNGDIDSLARAFSYMEKNTGRSGLNGFYQTINEIGKIPDVAERGKAAVAAFGRSGLDLIPLINAANDGTDALRGVIDAMPAIPKAAADAGDEAADAMNIVGNGFKSIWLQAIGAVCSMFGEDFAGGIREAAAQAANALEYYVKLACSRCAQWIDEILEPIRKAGNIIGGFIGSEGSISERWKSAIAITDELSAEREKERQKEKEQWNEREARWQKAYEDRKQKIEELQSNYDNAAKSTQVNSGTAADLNSESNSNGITRSPRLNNALVMANSNDANRLAILGPEFESDSKKQIDLLNKIEKNTRDISGNTDETKKDGEDYGTID